MKKALFILLIVMTAMSCKNASSDKSQATTDTKSEAPAESKAKGKYAIKSGIIEYKTTVMGFEATQTTYFDDFGALEANYVSMEIMGTKSENLTLNKENYIYTIDLVNKTGTKTYASPNSNINFETLTDQAIMDWKLKKEGKETVMGKECDKWFMDNDDMSMKGYYWVWKGVALKVDLDMSISKMLMEATKFEENASIPAGKFEIPADIVFN